MLISCFDVYFLSHFKGKQYFARMVKVDLTLDHKDFVVDKYLVDEEW